MSVEPIQPIDLLVVLKVATLEGRSGDPRRVAEGVGLAEQDAERSMRRLAALGLLLKDPEKGPESWRVGALSIVALRQCLQHSVQWIAPGNILGPGPGLPTAHSAPPLSHRIFGDEDVLVMPLREGAARGRIVTPLHPLAPDAAARDAKLYALLAIVDGIRVGGARVRGVAAEELARLLRKEDDK